MSCGGGRGFLFSRCVQTRLLSLHPYFEDYPPHLTGAAVDAAGRRASSLVEFEHAAVERRTALNGFFAIKTLKHWNIETP